VYNEKRKTKLIFEISKSIKIYRIHGVDRKEKHHGRSVRIPGKAERVAGPGEAQKQSEDPKKVSDSGSGNLVKGSSVSGQKTVSRQEKKRENPA